MFLVSSCKPKFKKVKTKKKKLRTSCYSGIQRENITKDVIKNENQKQSTTGYDKTKR